MRIGILTLPLHTNYGGILQAYALQTVLERMGHEVCLIQKQNFPLYLPLWKAPLSYGKRILKNLLGNPMPIFYEKKYNYAYPIVSQKIRTFIDNNIHAKNITTLEEINKSDFDCIIVGSDQVWRPTYFEPMYKTGIDDAFLKFAENWDIKRIAYAVSFGTSKWEYSYSMTKKCAELASKFNAISVRETTGLDLCKQYLGSNVCQCLDPTMLLSINDYKQIAKAEKKEGLMLYLLDSNEQKLRIANSVSHELGMHVYSLMPENDFLCSKTTKLDNAIFHSVESWVQGFIDASFIVTDSFHGTVFSIIFNKPFITIVNEKRGADRFTSLLRMFGLEDRLLISESCMNPNKFKDSIDYVKINDILLKEKGKSLSFIVNALS